MCQLQYIVSDIERESESERESSGIQICEEGRRGREEKKVTTGKNKIEQDLQLFATG